MNRQACLQSLDAEITRASRHDRSLAVALVDIDHFKKVNDTYGHAAGDIVLHHVAQLLRSNLRSRLPPRAGSPARERGTS
jgi:diguanylate cyclase (GGDEF)-like protein